MKIGLIGAAYFIGWTSTTLFIPRLADKYGRRWIVRCSLMVTWAGIVGIVASRSINLTISMNLFIGMAASGRILTGYVYAADFMVPKWRIIFGAIWLGCDST